MNVEIITCGYSVQKGTRKTTCGIVLTATNNQDKFERSICYNLGSGVTINAAHLFAAIAGIMSIKVSQKAILVVGDTYVGDVLNRGDDGEWTVTPKMNTTLVQALRKVFDPTRIQVVVDKGERSAKAKALAKEAAASSQHTDTGTIWVDKDGTRTPLVGP